MEHIHIELDEDLHYTHHQMWDDMLEDGEEPVSRLELYLYGYVCMIIPTDMCDHCVDDLVEQPVFEWSPIAAATHHWSYGASVAEWTLGVSNNSPAEMSFTWEAPGWLE